MANPPPVPADDEVAAAVFDSHLARACASAQARAHGWTFTRLDRLHVVVRVEATRPSGEKDHYFVKLGAEYYDLHPPTTSFVCPPTADPTATAPLHSWRPARRGGRWFPLVDGLPWFAVHDAYQYTVPDNPEYTSPRQLVCCSMTFEYYISGHDPTDGQRWRQGRHTLSATLNRIHDALNSDNYQGPSGADNS